MIQTRVGSLYWYLNLTATQREGREKQKEAAKEAAKQQKEAVGERRKLEKENGKIMDEVEVCTAEHNHTPEQLRNSDEGFGVSHSSRVSKKYDYRVHPTNILETGTKVWKMKRPSADFQTRRQELGSQADDLALEKVELEYLAIVIQGEDFADLVERKALHEHISRVREQYPTYSVCYLINGLKRFLHRKEQQEFKKTNTSWTLPNVEQALAALHELTGKSLKI